MINYVGAWPIIRLLIIIYNNNNNNTIEEDDSLHRFLPYDVVVLRQQRYCARRETASSIQVSFISIIYIYSSEVVRE